MIHTRQQYVESRRAWFADATSRMRMEPVTRRVRNGLGVALDRGTYADVHGQRDQLVALTFAREDGEWRLVFDQSSPTPPKASR